MLCYVMLLFMLNIIASSFFTLLYVARIYVASYTLFILFYFFANPVLRRERELRERDQRSKAPTRLFLFKSPSSKDDAAKLDHGKPQEAAERVGCEQQPTKLGGG